MKEYHFVNDFLIISPTISSAEKFYFCFIAIIAVHHTLCKDHLQRKKLAVTNKHVDCVFLLSLLSARSRLVWDENRRLFQGKW